MTTPPNPAVTIETSGGDAACVLHASCVAYQNRAVILIGPSGAGKSSLALQLMGLGAALISDDKIHVRRCDEGLLVTAPSTIKGLIEARGVGILRAETCGSAVVRLVVDLSQEEGERLPPQRSYNLLGQSLPLLHKVKATHFAAAILQYLIGGRHA